MGGGGSRVKKGRKRALETGLEFEGGRGGRLHNPGAPPREGWRGGGREGGMKACRVAALQIESEAQEVEEQEMDGRIRGS